MNLCEFWNKGAEYENDAATNIETSGPVEQE